MFNNFNFSKAPEHDLNSSLAKEMINLYGIRVKFIIVDRINTDKSIFGDYSHLKSNATDTFDISVLPEDTENWDDSGYSLSAFGPINFENIVLFVHRDIFKDLLEIQKITGNLLVFPNNKIMEITDTESKVPGVNNLFTYQDAKTLLKLTCKPYDQKIINELDQDSLFYDSKPQVNPNPDYNNDNPYESLDKYFEELMDNKEEFTQDVEVIPSVSTIKPGEKNDEEVKKPIIDKNIDDVWGNY